MKDLEASGRTEQAGSDLEDTEYKPVNWKRLFFSPKYIRMCDSWLGSEDRENLDWPNNSVAWHLLGIAILVATVLIAVKHDEVIEVSFGVPHPHPNNPSLP